MSSAFGKMTIQARDRIAGPGVSMQTTYDYFDSLISDKSYINFIFHEKKQNVLEYFRILSALGRDKNRTHAQLVMLLPPNEQRIEMEQLVRVQQQAVAEAQARAQREAEAEAEAKRQREARAEAQRQEAERQREAQRQEAERQANAALKAKLNANNAQKTPRTRKRNQNKANRNTRNLLASNINNAPINQQILRGRQVRLDNLGSRNQLLQNYKDSAEYLTHQLISAIPRSTDIEGLKQLYKKHYNPILKISDAMEEVNKKIGIIHRKKKMSQVEKDTEIEKLFALMAKLQGMLRKKVSFLKLIENRIRELIPSIKTHANFINEVAVPKGTPAAAAAAIEEAAPASLAAAAAAAAVPAAPAAQAAAAVPPEYGPQGLRAPGGQLQNEDEDAPPGNAAQAPPGNAAQAPPGNAVQALEEATARLRISNQAIAQEAREQAKLIQRANIQHQALLMPNPLDEQAQREVEAMMAKKGGRKRTRKDKKSRRY